ncbi:ParB N-terminal domain-containing protein [Roseomonas rosulenta]|uniref:hypothetical protein n=1 Tax=Roseomonas rosulenta TaxID=2748667 RepID=UPI0018E050A0|nr:hypothetical protein [Roseomonas rosulenta]
MRQGPGAGQGASGACAARSRTRLPSPSSRVREAGFTNPVLTDGDNGIIAGHGRVLSARKLGLAVVPVIERAHLTPVHRRA